MGPTLRAEHRPPAGQCERWAAVSAAGLQVSIPATPMARGYLFWARRAGSPSSMTASAFPRVRGYAAHSALIGSTIVTVSAFSGPPEQAGRPCDQHDHHDNEDNGRGSFGPEDLGQPLHDAEHEAGDNGAED